MNDQLKATSIGLILGVAVGSLILYSTYLINKQLSTVCSKYDAVNDRCVETVERKNLTLETARGLYYK